MQTRPFLQDQGQDLMFQEQYQTKTTDLKTKTIGLKTKTNEKSVQRETQTLRDGCSKVEPKNFAPPQTLPGGAGRQNLISWRWSLTFTYKPSLVMIDARNFELSW